MFKNSSTDVADSSHDEKSTSQDEKSANIAAEAPLPETNDDRRQSVALNIVENPLKVSFATPGLSPSIPKS